jgi:hypothetical protein
LPRDYVARFPRNGPEIHATPDRDKVVRMEPDPDQSKIIRWIPIVVPLSALVLVLGVYTIAAEVLSRLMP